LKDTNTDRWKKYNHHHTLLEATILSSWPVQLLHGSKDKGAAIKRIEIDQKTTRLKVTKEISHQL